MELINKEFMQELVSLKLKAYGREWEKHVRGMQTYDEMLHANHEISVKYMRVMECQREMTSAVEAFASKCR